LSIDLQGLSHRGSYLRVPVFSIFDGGQVDIIFAHLLPVTPVLVFTDLALSANAVRTGCS
jgi:hypothetical protein